MRRAGAVPFRGSFRRTGLAALAVAATFGASAVTTLSSSPPAGADTAFVPGEGTAVAQAIAFAPSTAGLNYAVTLATSIADFQASQGQAKSQTLDTGAIGLSLTSTGCDGSAPTINASQLPQPAEAESTGSTQNQTKTVAGVPGGAGAGVEQASATSQPSSSAVTKISDLGVPGSFDIAGAQSTAETQIIGGQTREAVSTADIQKVSLMGGLIVLSGLHWVSTQRTGATTTATGSFAVGSVTVAGIAIPVSTDSLAQVFTIVNTALVATGFHLTPPQAVTEPDGTQVETPMSIGIDGSALGAAVVGPLLGPAQPLRDAIDKAVLGVSCKLGIGLLVGDISLGVLAGGGNLDIELGGARAVTDGTAYGNPFGTFGLLGSSTASDGGTPSVDLGGGSTVDTTPAVTTGGSLDSGSTGSTGSPAGAAAPGTTASTGTPGAEALGPLTRSVSCHSLSPAGGGCSPGAAVPVGLAGVAVVVGFTIADLARYRRRRRFAPEGER